jgi:hypothetical protein
MKLYEASVYFMFYFCKIATLLTLFTVIVECLNSN